MWTVTTSRKKCHVTTEVASRYAGVTMTVSRYKRVTTCMRERVMAALLGKTTKHNLQANNKVILKIWQAFVTKLCVVNLIRTELLTWCQKQTNICVDDKQSGSCNLYRPEIYKTEIKMLLDGFYRTGKSPKAVYIKMIELTPENSVNIAGYSGRRRNQYTISLKREKNKTRLHEEISRRSEQKAMFTRVYTHKWFQFGKATDKFGLAECVAKQIIRRVNQF